MWKKEDDWFWEGNIQEKLAIFFRNLGYEVTAWAFEKLDIHIFIVKSSGEVYKK